MRIFYGESLGWPDVPSKSPIDVSLENALEIFRKLHAARGFMGIQLDERSVLQLLSSKRATRIELLDSSVPAIDACYSDCRFAEQLIEAAANDEDVFQIARQRISQWDHLKLR